MIIKIEDLPKPKAPPEPRRSRILVTNPSGKTKISTNAITEIDLEAAKAKIDAGMEAHLEVLAERIVKGGGTVYDRRKK